MKSDSCPEVWAKIVKVKNAVKTYEAAAFNPIIYLINSSDAYGTNALTSPPLAIISLTTVDEIEEYSSLVRRIIVSRFGESFCVIWAMVHSYSKSEEFLTPLRSHPAYTSLQKSAVRLLKD